MWWTRPNPKHSTRSCSSFAKAFLMSSIISLDHEIVQLPDSVGMLWVYQTSQRNWVAIKVHYRYLQKCLLGWHGSRLDLSLRMTERYLWAHLVRHHRNELNVTKGLVMGWCARERVKWLAVTRLNKVSVYRRSIDKGNCIRDWLNPRHHGSSDEIIMEHVGANMGIQIPLLVIGRRDVSVMFAWFPNP